MRKVLISVLLSILAFVSTSQEIANNVMTCDCPNSLFSEKNNPPLLKHKFINQDLVVCGYRLEREEGIILGEKQKDGSFYASGFEIFSCKMNNMKQIFIDGEYYLDLIDPIQDTLFVNRLMRMPQDKSLRYEWTPVIAYRLYEEDQNITIDTIFVFPVEKYNQDFLDHFNSEINSLVKGDHYGQYEEYLIDYTFIKAVKDPKKYSKSLKSLGPFDGYLGQVYRDMLMYFDVFYKDFMTNK